MTERQKHICFKSWFCLVCREQSNCVVQLSQKKKKKKIEKGISERLMEWTGNDRGNSVMINAVVMHSEGEK